MTSDSEIRLLLDHNKAFAESSAKRRGEVPQDRKPRQQLIAEANRGSLTCTRGIMHCIHVPEQYYPCALPFDQLEKEMIKNLQLEVHHRGRYLLVRAITKPIQHDGVMMVVEDEDGDAVQLELYHQLNPRVSKERKAKELPTMGTMVVKEPYFQVTLRGDYVIRVDHVSDIVWLPDTNERVPAAWSSHVRDLTANDWRMEGNAAFRAGYYREAIAKYTTALTCPVSDEQESRAIRLNRATAYLKCECYEHALADASVFLDDPQPPEKAYYMGAMALYRLGRFDDCQARLNRLLADNPESQAGKALMHRVQQRLLEQASGCYDFDRLHMLVEQGERELDIATFTGPVEVRESEGRGRGLFTTQAVNAGDLLICEKAFVHCRAPMDWEETSSYMNVVFNPEVDKFSAGAPGDIVTIAIQKTFRNPSFAAAASSFYCGDYKPVAVSGLVDGQPVVDFYLIGNVLKLTAYGISLSTYRDSWEPTQYELAAKEVEEQLWNIERFRFRAAGLWLFAALLNHSCLPNANRSNIGDVLIVRAAVDIPAGEELTLAYMSRGDRFAKEKLSWLWGIECRCPACDAERTTPPDVRAHREAALAHAAAALDAVKAIRTRYTATPGSQIPEQEAARWTLQLGGAHVSVRNAVHVFGLPASAVAAIDDDDDDAAGAGAGAASEAGAAPAAGVEWVPQVRLAQVLQDMAVECVFLAMTPPFPPKAAMWMRAWADPAATYVLDAMRALGYVVHEHGNRWPTDARRAVAGSGGGGAPSTGAARRRARRALQEQRRQQQNHQAEAPTTPPPALVVEKWGVQGSGLREVWFGLLNAYVVGGAHAALVDAAKGYARTHYRAATGEDVTFERQYDKRVAPLLKVGELHRQQL